MPSKRVTAKDALKKTRKNFKKVFSNEENPDDFRFINNFLASKKLRELSIIFDSLTLNPLDADLESGKYDLFNSIRDVLDDLILISEHNDDASALTDILTTTHMKGYVESVNNVASRQYIPEINIIKVVKASSLHSLKSDVYGSINPSITDISGNLLPGLGNDVYYSHNSLNNKEDPNQVYMQNQNDNQMEELQSSFGEPIIMIGIPKEKGESLGITVGIRHIDFDGTGPIPRIVVERIMAGSKIEKQNLLAPGDIVTEVNGTIVDSPELLQKLMKDATGIVTLKVIPVERSKVINSQLYLRAFFAYDPNFDTLIPCKEAGLPFLPGDILQVLNQDDIYWWQARHANAMNRAGLIPTEYLEERRKAYMQNAKDPNEVKYKILGIGVGKKKKQVKVDFSAKFAHDYDQSDITMYEEVSRIPPFKRTVICLVASSGVGRTTIRDELLRRFPDKFACPLRDTSRPKRVGEPDNKYHFVDRDIMQMEHLNNRYLDFGEYNDQFYGVHLKTVREIIKSGRTCLIDCSPEAARKLKTEEFMPWVLFLAAPSIDCMRAMHEYGYHSNLTEKTKYDEDFHNSIEESIQLERTFRHIFDDIIVIDNMQASFEKILEKIENLEKKPQWVPVKWVY